MKKLALIFYICAISLSSFTVLNKIYYNKDTLSSETLEAADYINYQDKASVNSNPISKRFLTTECSSLDFQLCSRESHCIWCSVDDCGVEKCVNSEKRFAQSEEQFTFHHVKYYTSCPDYVNLDKYKYGYTFRISKYHVSGPCQWEVKNSRKRKVSIEIDKGYKDDVRAESILSCKNWEHCRKTTKDEVLRFYYKRRGWSSFGSVEIKLTIRRGFLFYFIVFLIVCECIAVLGAIGVIICYVCKHNLCENCCKCCESSSYAISSPVRESRYNEVQKQILNNSPESLYNERNEYGQFLCTICLDSFRRGVIIRTLICNHIFHKNCIEHWIKYNIKNKPKCPLCVTDITAVQKQDCIKTTSRL